MSGNDAREWVLAGAVGDLGDFIATATAEDIPVTGRIAVFAMAGAAIAVSAGYLASAPDG
jgi:hypothetical protein